FTANNRSIDVFRKTKKNGLNSLIISFNLFKFLFSEFIICLHVKGFIHRNFTTDDELTEKKLKQIEADDQAIQTILLGLPEDIYAAVVSCETAQEIWLRVQQMMKGSDIGIQEKKAKLFNE
nr:hypothetical protein [Tanacetum cinerariifolium]